MRQFSSVLIFFVCLASSISPGMRLRADEQVTAVIPGESRPIATRLEEAGKLLADKKPAEAIALLQNVIEASGTDLVAIKGGRSIRARHLAQAMLARLDPKDLEVHRRKVNPQAQKWLDQAASTGDAGLLRRIVDEAFCSRSALQALVHLGDRAFERGRFDEAETWWQLIAPLEPIKLADADVLVQPDPPAALVARTRAKQILAHIFRGQSGWKTEVKAFRKLHPKATGTLAGRTGLYADTLTAVAVARVRKQAVPAGDWPTFAGAGNRGKVVPAPPRLLDRLSQLCRRGPTWRFDLEDRSGQRVNFPALKQSQEADAARRLAFYPVVVGHQALVADAQFITCYDLRSGKANIWYNAGDYTRIKAKLDLPTPLLDLRYTLTVAEGCVFARLGAQSIKDVRPDPRRIGRIGGGMPEDSESILVSLSLTANKEGDRRRWMVRAIDQGRKESSVFEGAPVVSDGRVYIAASRFEGDQVITAIHCYPAHPEDSTPPLLWRTDVCETRELLPAGAGGGAVNKQGLRNRHHLLTLAGSRIVYCSHSGAIVAVDARTGSRAWAVKYPHRELREPADVPAMRDLVPCLFSEGRLYAAPTDSDRLMCLDPATGSIQWQRDHFDVVHLLGVGQGRLIFTTWRNPRQGNLFGGGLRAVMADDGSDTGGWVLPDDGGGLAPFGRGLLIGDLVLWPTPVPLPASPRTPRKPYGVFVVRQIDGQQPDNPTLLHRVPSGNLVYANDCLLVTDRQTLYAFVPPELVYDEDDKEKAERAIPAEALRSARTAAAKGEWERALQCYAVAVKGIDESSPGQIGRQLLNEVRRERLELYLAAADKAFAAADAKQAAEWLSKLQRAPPRYRLAALLRMHRAQKESGAGTGTRKPAPPRLDADLQDLIVDDEQGLPQRASQTKEVRASRLDGGGGEALEVDRKHPPRLSIKAMPAPSLPLRRLCDVKLQKGEIFLPAHAPEGPVAERVWSGQERALLCRSRSTGEVLWKKDLPFRPEWLGGLGSIVVIGGREGMASLRVGDGNCLWTFAAPALGREPGTLDGTMRIVLDVLPPEPLSDFHLAGDRLLVVQGGRRLLALDALAGRVVWQRWAPGAAFGMPAPRGRYQILQPVGDDNLLVQVSARRWLLDASTGKVRYEAPATLERWPRAPLLLEDGRVCIVSNTRTVEVLDAGTAKVVWTYTLAGRTTLSGEPPLVVGSAEALFVVEPQNIGYRLTRLNGSTGKPVWPRSPLVALERLEPSSWLVGPKALYSVDAGQLIARSLADGEMLWRQPLGANSVWKLALAEDTLLVQVEHGDGLRFQFRWLCGSLQWELGPLGGEASGVELRDAQMGTLMQRINIEDAFLRSRTASFSPVRDTASGLEASRSSVFPQGLFWRFPRSFPGPIVWWDGKGLLASLGNRVKVLAAE